jgi:predicted ATPase
MDIDVELKNYRCFPDANQARFTIGSGFTAFVGANNSGKSSLLKFLFEFRNLFGFISSPNGNLIAALRGSPQSVSLNGLFDPREVFSNTNDRDIEIELKFHDPDYAANPTRPPFATGLTVKISRRDLTWTAAVSREQGAIPTDNGFSYSGNLLMSGRGEALADLDGLFRPCGILTRCLYVGPFRNAINVGGGNYFDIQVGQQFIQAWRQYKTGMNTAANEATYRLTQDIKNLFGFSYLEINPTPDNETLQVFIEGKSYKLPELGSGIAQFIIVLANAAIRQPSFVLIDEPELNLHPSLQLSFLTMLASYATNGILFGTHSIGLAKTSAERIYSLRRMSEGRSEMHPYESLPDLAQFLGELGYAGYRELGIEKVLLVEGPSDARTVRQFLRKLGKENSFLVLPLGGAALINPNAESELAEVQRISGHVFALVDSEKTSPADPVPGDRLAFQQVCARLGINCRVLDRRSLDNYLSDAAVKRVKGNKYRALGAYESLNHVSPAWSKAENWRIAMEMNKSDLDGTDLGAFFEAL